MTYKYIYIYICLLDIYIHMAPVSYGLVEAFNLSILSIAVGQMFRLNIKHSDQVQSLGP
jgi:hypothetical protein